LKQLHVKLAGTLHFHVKLCQSLFFFIRHIEIYVQIFIRYT